MGRILSDCRLASFDDMDCIYEELILGLSEHIGMFDYWETNPELDRRFRKAYHRLLEIEDNKYLPKYKQEVHGEEREKLQAFCDLMEEQNKELVIEPLEKFLDDLEDKLETLEECYKMFCNEAEDKCSSLIARYKDKDLVSKFKGYHELKRAMDFRVTANLSHRRVDEVYPFRNDLRYADKKEEQLTRYVEAMGLSNK